MSEPHERSPWSLRMARVGGGLTVVGGILAVGGGRGVVGLVGTGLGVAGVVLWLWMWAIDG